MKIKYLFIFLFTLFAFSISNAAQFTPGNIVVYRVGDASALSSACAPVFLDEYTTAGVLVQSIALPTIVSGLNLRCVASGTATSEGFLSLSNDGRYIIFGGYDTTVGGAFGVATVKRVIGRIDLSGNMSTETYFTDGATGNIRSVFSTEGTNMWAATSSVGVRYMAFGNAGTSIQMSTSPTNTRVVNVYNGQLYISSASGTFQGVASIGTGIPTTSGQTTTMLPGFPTTAGPSSYGYAINAAGTIAYVADDRVVASGGGIQKWTQSGGTWTLAYTLNTNLGTNGCRGVTVNWNGVNPVIYATTAATNNNAIVSVTDAGSSSSFSSLVSTGVATRVFRGIAFAPNSVSISGAGSLNAGTYNNISLTGPGAVSLNGNITVNGDLSFSSGAILSTGINAVFFSNTASKPIENSTMGYILGNAVMSSRPVGIGIFDFLGVHLEGGDDVGSMVISRITGDNGIVTVGSNSGIRGKWAITSTIPTFGARNMSLSWTSEFDNLKTSPFTIWKSTDEGSSWAQQGGTFASNLDPRFVGPISVTSFSQWTISDAAHPLPVELTDFIASTIKNEVILDWVTGNEMNNSHFVLERVKLSRNGSHSDESFSRVAVIPGIGNSNQYNHYKYSDKNLETGKYLYRLNQVDYNGNVQVYLLNQEVIVGVPNKFAMSQNFPNPFNPVTKFNYELPQDLNVSMKVYDMTGREVATLVNELQPAGYHTVDFNASNLSSGLYFAKLVAGNFTAVKKISLIK